MLLFRASFSVRLSSQSVVTSKWMTSKPQSVQPAIRMVRVYVPEYCRHLLFFNTRKIPDIKVSDRLIRGDGTGRHPFILIEKDRFLLTSIVNFIKAVREPFTQQQVHGIIRYILESMIRAPSIKAFIHGPSLLEPVIVLNLLDLSERTRKESNDFCRNAYLKAIFNTIVDWLDPHYPHYPH